MTATPLTSPDPQPLPPTTWAVRPASGRQLSGAEPAAAHSAPDHPSTTRPRHRSPAIQERCR